MAPFVEVIRIDDNGNVFVVCVVPSQEEAERLVARFDARGHKQVYFWRYRPSAVIDAAAIPGTPTAQPYWSRPDWVKRKP